MLSLFYDAQVVSKDPSKSEDLYDISLNVVCVCVCFFFCGEEIFTPAQLQDGEPFLSAVCDIFNIGLGVAKFQVNISYILCLKRRSYMVTRNSLVANGYTFLGFVCCGAATHRGSWPPHS